MDRTYVAVQAGVMLLAGSNALADLGLVPNIAITTDYVSEGISQSDGEPAVQGGLDVSGPGGFYAGIWASNVDISENEGVPTAARVDGASIELDLFAGLTGQLGKFGWDTGLLYYSYPGAERDLHYDYWEANGRLSRELGRLAASVSIGYSPEYLGRSDREIYYALDFNLTGPEEVRLGMHLGRELIEDNAAYGVPDYNEWKLSAFKDFDDFSVDLSYTDTDIGAADCFGSSDVCGPRVVLTLSKEF